MGTQGVLPMGRAGPSLRTLEKGAAAAGRWAPSRYDGAAGAYCRRHTLLRVANKMVGGVGPPAALWRAALEPTACEIAEGR